MINNINNGNWWNYGNANKENYRDTIKGEIVEIAEVQSYDSHTKQPEFWPANPVTGIANPKLDIRFRILQENGEEMLHSFKPKGPEARALQAMYKTQYGKSLARWSDLCGEIVSINTPNGVYSATSPRVWNFQFFGKGQHEGEYVEFDLSELRQPAPQAQPAYQGQPYMQPPQIAQPQGYYQQQTQPQPQPVMQQAQPVPQQQQFAQMPNPFAQQQAQPAAQQPMAQAQAQPMAQALYEDEIPF